MAQTHNIEILAYTAGLLDGEGSVGIYRRIENRSKTQGFGVYRYRIMICIVSTTYIVLTFLKDKFGGAIYKATGGLGNKQCWKWQINGGKEANKFLQQVLPYLIIKKDQAKTVLAFGKTLVKSQYEMTDKIRVERDSLYNHIREVN